MNVPFFSIIIPVYNVEKYLKDIKRFEMDEVIRKWISLLEGV